MLFDISGIGDQDLGGSSQNPKVHANGEPKDVEEWQCRQFDFFAFLHTSKPRLNLIRVGHQVSM